MNPNEHFADIAERFCSWVESEHHDPTYGRALLLELLLYGAQLDVENHVIDCSKDYPRRGHEGWQADYLRFKDLPFSYYKEVAEPFDLSVYNDVVTGDLHDDLADIYGDLWQGLAAWKSGDTASAMGLWHQSYLSHWGAHASAAAHALYTFLRRG